MTQVETSMAGAEVRPFRVEVREEDLVELRRRLAATRWPEKETVADQSQGVQLATIQALVRYWEAEYDFGRLEARLNALPSSRPRSTASTSTSSTSGPRTRTRCR
jgi:Epoxide hydrolase N terminus